MTTDQRLDRIERILVLYFNSGRRERRRVREMDEKINILINAQIKNEDGFRELRDQMRETFREIRDLFWKTDERLNRLDDAQKRSDRKLNELSDHS